MRIEKQPTDLEKLQRMRDIPDSSIKEIDSRTYEINAQSDNHKEVIYMVTWIESFNKWVCTCKSFMFRNTEDNPTYTCKHIDRILEYRLKKELNVNKL